MQPKGHVVSLLDRPRAPTQASCWATCSSFVTSCPGPLSTQSHNDLIKICQIIHSEQKAKSLQQPARTPQPPPSLPLKHNRCHHTLGESPIATVTKYGKLSGSIQFKFILQFQNQPHWAKINMLAGLSSFWRF